MSYKANFLGHADFKHKNVFFTFCCIELGLLKKSSYDILQFKINSPAFVNVDSIFRDRFVINL